MRWLDQPVLEKTSLPGLHPLVSSALIHRGITTLEKAESFLNPTLYSPSPSVLMPGMERAVDRLIKAIHSHQQIFVWGDFDVDGQTATTLLVQVLRSVDANIDFHIPVRANESHGVNIPILKQAIDNGARVILTCDTGISAHAAIQYASDHDVDVIVTDHHNLPATLPNAFALINPKFLPGNHPLADLSGVGVAYKLAELLLSQADAKIEASDFLDIVALGLISDLANLCRDTRYLAQMGIQSLRTTKRLGLQALYEMAELDPGKINESHIGFVLGPRLNAMGRLGDANPIVDFFLTSDKQKTMVMAELLESYNAQRQLLTSQVTQAAEAQLKNEPSLLEAPIIIVHHPTWPAGVLGIAAARLVERYHKPAIVLATPTGKPAHGSARSVEALNITAAIASNSDLVLNFGGHPMAAGFALAEENIPTFQRRMVKTAQEMMASSGEMEPTMFIDSWLTLADISFDLASALETISPFGPGNPQPIFASRNLLLEETITIGRNNEHRKLIVKDQAGISQEILWWNGGIENPPEGVFDLAYTLRQSDWRGTSQLQLEFVDFKNAESNNLIVKREKHIIEDFRKENDPDSLLTKAKSHPSGIIWAEGQEKSRVSGTDRFNLTHADLLIIWTIPPSPEDLSLALEKVKPKTIWLVGCHKPADNFETFILTLTSMVKYALSHESGMISYAKLTGATGQNQVTVEMGINWLVAKGIIEVDHATKDMVDIKIGNSAKDASLVQEIQSNIRSLLAETKAYREYFSKAGKDSLFP